MVIDRYNQGRRSWPGYCYILSAIFIIVGIACLVYGIPLYSKTLEFSQRALPVDAEIIDLESFSESSYNSFAPHSARQRGAELRYQVGERVYKDVIFVGDYAQEGDIIHAFYDPLEPDAIKLSRDVHIWDKYGLPAFGVLFLLIGMALLLKTLITQKCIEVGDWYG